jgi:hypothetical protein
MNIFERLLAVACLYAPIGIRAQSSGADSLKRDAVDAQSIVRMTRSSAPVRLRDFAPAVPAVDTGGECRRVATTPVGGAMLAVAFPSRAAPQMSVTLTTAADGRLLRVSEFRGVPVPTKIPPGAPSGVRDSLLTAARTRDRTTMISVDFMTGTVVASNIGGGLPDTSATGDLREVDQLPALHMPVARAARALALCRMPSNGAPALAPKAAVDIAGTLRAGLPPDSTVSLLLTLLRAKRYQEAAQLFELTNAERGRTDALQLLRVMISRKEIGFDLVAMGKAAAALDKQAIADTLHIPGVADTAVTIASLARMPIVDFLALGARIRDASASSAYYRPVATGIEQGDTVAHVVIRPEFALPLTPSAQARVSAVEQSQTLHLRRVNNRWLFVGHNFLMGPMDVQIGVMSTQMMAGLSSSLTLRSATTPPATPSTCDAVKTPLFEFQVDQPARYLDDGKSSPKPMVRGDATTLMQFVVDTAGVPVDKTYRMLKSVSVEFTNDVLKIAPSWRFEPAKKGGCKVPQLVQTPVVR